MEKAKALFDGLSRRIETADEAKRRTAQETHEVWDDASVRLRCENYTMLYVALARAVGLKAFFTHVDNDPEGKVINHACAAVFCDDKVWLVDALWNWFGVSHKRYRIWNDLEVAAYYNLFLQSGQATVSRCKTALKLCPKLECIPFVMVEALGCAKGRQIIENLDEPAANTYSACHYYIYKGHYAYHDKDWEMAERWLRKAISIAPTQQLAYFELGRILHIQGKLEPAREQLRNSLQHSQRPEFAAKARRRLSQITEQLWSNQPISSEADPFNNSSVKEDVAGDRRKPADPTYARSGSGSGTTATASESSASLDEPKGSPAVAREPLSERRRLVASGFKASWSPDGTRLVFGKPGGEGLQILDLDSKQTTDLTSSGKDPAWSPDGRFIAYVCGKGLSDETWLVKSTGESPRKLVDGGYPSWSADGKSLYVHSRKQRRILILAVDKPDAEPKVFFDNPQSRYPAISPDGELIALGRKISLVIVDRETGKTLLTGPAPGSRGLLPAWSPNGSQIAYGNFGSNQFGLWILDLRTKKTRRVVQGSYTMPAWSKDGAKLAFDLRSGNRREIWMVETKALAALKYSPPKVSRPESPLIGEFAKPFTLPDLNGKQVSLSDFKGKVVLLDFWATWCGPCWQAIPHLEALHRKYKDQGLVVIGLNNEKDHDMLRKFAKKQMSYVVLLQADDQFKQYGIGSIPTAFYIDREGRIHSRDTGFGPGSEEQIEQKIRELLAEKEE